MDSKKEIPNFWTAGPIRIILADLDSTGEWLNGGKPIYQKLLC